jgi:hypothetical protein
MRPEKTFADLSPRDVIHIHCDCGRDRLLMPITLLSDGKVKGKSTIEVLEAAGGHRYVFADEALRCLRPIYCAGFCADARCP